MKQYGGFKTYDQLVKDAIDDGWKVNTKSYDEGGDYIYFSRPLPQGTENIAYNGFNHTMMMWMEGPTGKKKVYHSNNIECDRSRWATGLMDRFYLPLKR